MTRIDDIADLIRQKNWLFQVSIPGTAFSSGRKTEQSALLDSPSLEDYFTQVMRANKVSQILVKLFSNNGSSFKLREEHFVFLPSTLPVATNTAPVATTATNVATTATTVATNATTVATTPAFAGFADEQRTTSISKKMDYNDQIAFGILQVKHEMTVSRKDELDAKVKQLEAEVRKLHDEKLDLLRQTTVQKERNELEIERSKLEVERDQKGGLSGIMGELKENPELISLIAGLINPNHPMFNKQPQISGPGTVDSYHSDPQAHNIISAMLEVLKTMDGEKISMLYIIFQNYMINPALIDADFNKYKPTGEPK